MDITENFIKIEKIARYYTNNPVLKNVNCVWIVIHGYAELAREFINQFNFLSGENILLIAPEGLSKFYFRNKIGASWMTKEDRLNEINDYTNYLENVFNDIKSKYDLCESQINLLGFSQGVHTAVRWFIKSNYHFDNLILCSSEFPRDADFKKLREKLSKSVLIYITGSHDEVVSQKSIDESFTLLKSNDIKFKEIIFEGKHEIPKETLKNLFNYLNH